MQEASKKKRSKKRGMSLHQKIPKLTVPLNDSSDDELRTMGRSSVEDAECFYCHGLFSEDHNGETWVMCLKCKN